MPRPLSLSCLTSNLHLNWRRKTLVLEESHRTCTCDSIVVLGRGGEDGVQYKGDSQTMGAHSAFLADTHDG